VVFSDRWRMIFALFFYICLIQVFETCREANRRKHVPGIFWMWFTFQSVLIVINGVLPFVCVVVSVSLSVMFCLSY
jgi:hypothetical protein